MVTQFKYQCSLCKGNFLSDWSDEEAQAEFKQNFKEQEKAIICDDCYKKIKKKIKAKK